MFFGYKPDVFYEISLTSEGDAAMVLSLAIIAVIVYEFFIRERYEPQ